MTAAPETTAAFAARVGVVAGTTGRPDGSFGLAGSEPAGEVIARWRAFRAARLPAFTAVQRSHQVHGTQVLWHAEVAPGWHEGDDADGHATAQPGLLLTVTIADCVPLFLVDRERRAVALLHAGWRGVAGGVLGSGVRLLSDRGVPAGSLTMHLGVAICGRCYEVGEAVARALLGAAAPAGASRVDLRDVLAGQAARLGIGEVSVAPACTSCEGDRYFSHRASGGAPGRQIAYLGLPLAAP